MSTMADGKPKRARRSFTEEFKPGAVHVLDERMGAPPRPASFPTRFPLVALDRIWVHPATAVRSVAVHRSPLSRRATGHVPVVAEIDGVDAEAVAAETPIDTTANDALASPGPGAA